MGGHVLGIIIRNRLCKRRLLAVGRFLGDWVTALGNVMKQIFRDRAGLLDADLIAVAKRLATIAVVSVGVVDDEGFLAPCGDHHPEPLQFGIPVELFFCRGGWGQALDQLAGDFLDRHRRLVGWRQAAGIPAALTTASFPCIIKSFIQTAETSPCGAADQNAAGQQSRRTGFVAQN